MGEIEDLFITLGNAEQNICLKLLASLWERCKQTLDSVSLPSSCEQRIIEAFTAEQSDEIPEAISDTGNDSDEASKEHEAVDTLICDIIDNAIREAEDKHIAWPATRLRERKPPQQNPAFNTGDAFCDDTDDYECDYDNDYDSELNIERRKRKQRFPKRTVSKSGVHKRSRERKPAVGSTTATVITRSSSSKTSTKSVNKSSQRHPKMRQTAKTKQVPPVKPESKHGESENLANQPFLNTPKLVQKSTPKPIHINGIEEPRIYAAIVGPCLKRGRGRPPKRKLYSCDHCQQTFTHVHSLYSHVTIHGEIPTSCRFCRKEFLNTISFNVHRCRHKKANLKAGVTERSLRLCRICGDEFKTVKVLQEHMKLEHGLNSHIPNYFCKFCKRAFVKKVSMYSHYKEHAEGQFVCIKCGEFCNTFEAYSLHMNEHEKDAKYTCEACDVSFIRAQQYEQHLKAHERHDCSKCAKSLSSRKALIKHCRMEHNEKLQIEDKIHECDVCQKKFARPGMLIVHKRLHTGMYIV